MKKKIVIKDSITNKTIEHEITLRNYNHFQAQLTNKAQVFKDKTKYTRKRKHKNQED